MTTAAILDQQEAKFVELADEFVEFGLTGTSYRRMWRLAGVVARRHGLTRSDVLGEMGVI